MSFYARQRMLRGFSDLLDDLDQHIDVPEYFIEERDNQIIRIPNPAIRKIATARQNLEAEFESVYNELIETKEKSESEVQKLQEIINKLENKIEELEEELTPYRLLMI